MRRKLVDLFDWFTDYRHNRVEWTLGTSTVLLVVGIAGYVLSQPKCLEYEQQGFTTTYVMVNKVMMPITGPNMVCIARAEEGNR